MDLNQFVESNPINVDYYIPTAEYNVSTLEVILPTIFSQQFTWDSVNKELPGIWVYLLNGEPIAYWNVEKSQGYKNSL